LELSDRGYKVILASDVRNSTFSHFKENYLTWSADDYVIKNSNLKALLKSIERQLVPVMHQGVK
jgi:hypothetical protein